MSRESLGNFELMVMLAVIRAGENAYGVPICAEIENRTGQEVSVGSVYAALDRLQAKGLIKSELGEATAERGGRAKRYFRVTGAGLRRAREAHRALVSLWTGLPQFEGAKT